MLNLNNHIPLYIQIQESIKSHIEQGSYGYGTQIPSEQELINIYGVSRITIRKAILELVRENILIKQQGKGTFVSKQKLERHVSFSYSNDSKVKSFTNLLQESGHQVTSKILSCEISTGTSDISSALQMEANEQVIYISRIRYVDSKPFSIEYVYYPFKLCSFLLDNDLQDASIYGILNNHDIFPSSILQFTVEAVSAGIQRANLLNISSYTPLLFQKILIGDDKNTPINYSFQYFIGNQYMFRLI